MRARYFPILFLMALAPGCSESTTEVTGTVTLDNVPVADGDIVFESDDGKAAASGKIKDGKYSVKVAPGPKKVRITATQPSDKIDPVMKAPMMKSIIPAAYNAQTTLTADVQASKSNTFDYPLKSKP